MKSIPNQPLSTKKFIVPPGLIKSIKEFEIHLDIGQNSPIMICGPSGVGKSLFLHIYKKLVREKYGSDCRIETVNCSHFSGDLARSELFGHIQGAFTGAVKKKTGWLKRADKGILVLEEIGDLPKATQACLLTFVETGTFHKVGSTVTERADVQIVAATNREADLRTDFRHRFFPFYVPPLYKRRQDILYYLAYLMPQLIPALNPWEITVLLAYNWPDNVREVERTGTLLMSKKQPDTEDTCLELWENAFDLADSEIFALPAANAAMQNAKLAQTGLCAIDYEAAPIQGYRAFQLYNELNNAGIDADYLEKLLNRYHIGLALNNETRPFSDFNPDDFHTAISVNQRFDVALCPPVKSFTAAYQGIEAFTNLFWSLIHANTNLLDIRNTPFNIPFYPINRFFKTSSRNIALFNAISAYISKNKKKGLKPPDEPHIYDLSYAELMKHYLESLLERTRGNQAEAARRAEMNYSTFRLKLKKFNVI
ncbi:sigma 54-interacting transcriptional regulator [Desulfococcaceae bacterium HSG9]|nr:sigma 54-interacting transcriptional regulator [Desulfococcaceae bacterium HSG9]